MAYQNIYIDHSLYPPAVHIWDDKQGHVTIPLSEFHYAFVRDPKGDFITMMGDRVSKTKRFSHGSPDAFESDVPKETRILVDLYLDEDTPSEGAVPLFFDIEVSMENGIPDIHTPNNEITSIALFDPISKRYAVFVLDKENIYTDRQTEEADIYFSDNEVNLLHKFMNKYEEISPTIITGWNSNGFDVPYLYNRLRQVCGKAVANRISSIGKVKYSERLDRYKIAGVSSLDYLDLYKKFTYTEQPNYRLDTIGRLELGMGKVDYEGSLDDLFREDLETFIEYNLQDVRIIVELDKKLDLIELVRGICHMGHVPYEDYNMSSRFLEGTILTYLHRKGIVATNKPQDRDEMMEEFKSGGKAKFSGAFVKAPIPGLYDWVYSLDLQSLYPSIIMTLNISPETKAGYVLNWDMEKHFKGEIKAYVIQGLTDTDLTVELEHAKFMKFLKDEDLSIASNGVLYRKDKVGIIPEILNNWFKQRKEYKDLMKRYTDEGNDELASYYNRRQHIQKIFLNSLYGVLGLPVFRFYDVDNAVAVTTTGQDVIKNTAKVVNLYYNKRLGKDDDYVTYIDTDSVYMSASPFVSELETYEEKKNSTIEIARHMEERLNTFYDVFAERAFNCNDHRFHIKGENVAKTGLWLAKKRYAMFKVYDLETNQDVDKIAVKGLDVVRSSFPQAFKDFMNDLLKDILNKVPKSQIDSNILKLKNSLKTKDYLDVARNTSVNNMEKYLDDYDNKALNEFKKGTPINIKSAIVHNRLIDYYNVEKEYEKIQSGTKIKYVYLRDNPLRVSSVAVKGYNDPPQIIKLIKTYVDTDALFEKELRNKLYDFYSAMGWGNIPTEVNQKAQEFFSF